MSSSDESVALEDGGGYDDWDDEGSEYEAAQSLFTKEVFPDAVTAMVYDAAHHGFDLAQFHRQRRLNEYDLIKIVNYIRTEVAASRDPRPRLQSREIPAPWDSDEFLQPVLPNDALLMHDFDDQPDKSGGNDNTDRSATAFGNIALLREQNEALRAALKLSAAGVFEDERHVNDTTTSSAHDNSSTATAAEFTPRTDPDGDSTSPACDGVPKSPSRSQSSHRVSFSASVSGETGRVDDSYFESYSYLDIHRDMLSDKVRTEAYRDALEQNPTLIRGKTVLDIGCGTGILSLFAARGGASKVVGVDGSARIADYARRIAATNGMSRESGGPVSIIAQKVEQLYQLPDGLQQVDVLVSEWMGYALLFESMLDSVLVARDRFLKPGGAILPDLATIHVAGGGPDAGGLGFWTDVYGFDMSLLADALTEASFKDAVVANVKEEHLVTEAVSVKTLDLSTMTASDADFTASFTLEPLGSKPALCRSIVVWFDVEFSSRFCGDHPVSLTTGPQSTPTHWAQALLTLRKPILLQKGSSDSPEGDTVKKGDQGGKPSPAVAISGRLSMARSSKHRSLDISLEYSAVAADGSLAEPQSAIYELAVSGAK